MPNPSIVLASASPYRKTLLAKLGLSFNCIAADIDESPHPGEAPDVLAQRLAQEKAEAVAGSHPNAIVIGSDQVCACGTTLLGKPGTVSRAEQQLQLSSGKSLTFHTGLCVIAPTPALQVAVIATRVDMRELSGEEISAYVARDMPRDCAGSFKWESLGIALFERMIGDDPTALEGLPLIRLSAMLRNLGINPLLI